MIVADRLARGEAVPGAVGTLMTNMAVELALRERGVALVRAKVGDRYVLEELTARGWQLGGEGSGHLLALDKHTTGDGIVSALQVLQAVRLRGKAPGRIARRRQPVPADADQCAPADGGDWRRNAAVAGGELVRRAELGDTGRVLIRASGTEPVLRVMVEAPMGRRPAGAETAGGGGPAG